MIVSAFRAALDLDTYPLSNLTSHLTTLRLHILTKTSANTDKSSSSQERLISLSPNLIFRTTPFYFVTYCSFCNQHRLIQNMNPNINCIKEVSCRVFLNAETEGAHTKEESKLFQGEIV